MYKASDEEARFKAYHDSLRRELNNANWHFTIYKHLDKLRGEYKKEMLEATVFWGLTQRSHLFDTIMRLNKICDNDKGTVNIHTLLNFAEQNVHIFTDESLNKRKYGSLYTRAQNLPKIDKRLLSKHRRKYATFFKTNLRKLRNRVLAHIDKDVVMKDIWPFKEWSVDNTQIITIINDLDDTLSLLSIAYDGGHYDKDFAELENSMRPMMDSIRMGLEEKERLRQAATNNSKGK